MIKDSLTASIAAAAKSVLLGESPEGPRSEGEKKFVALHQIELTEPPSETKAEESPKAPDSTEDIQKTDEPQDAIVPGQDEPVEDPSKVETPMTEETATKKKYKVSADLFSRHAGPKHRGRNGHATFEAESPADAVEKAKEQWKKQGYSVMSTPKVETINESDDSDTISADEINEILSKNAPASEWISDFVNSDDPRFEGKSKEERIKMALGAYYGAQNESVTEAVAPGADENLEKEYLAAVNKSDSAAAAYLKKKGILPGISSLRPGEIKLGVKNELNGKKTIYATDTDGKLIAISGTSSSPKIRYVVN